MSDEVRDSAGRLVSVVVDGQRFHRAPEVDLANLLNDVAAERDALEAELAAMTRYADAQVRGSMRAAAERDSLRAEVEICRRIRDEMQDVAGAAVAAKASAYVDLEAALAEVRSLRGVVHAVRASLVELNESGDCGKHAMDPQIAIIDAGLVAAAVRCPWCNDRPIPGGCQTCAAAADAPQPETKEAQR